MLPPPPGVLLGSAEISSTFLYAALALGVGMLIWDAIEVGRNDAANIVNAVFGARILSRRAAVWLAGAAVVIGATASSGVIETTRKGLFDPGMLDLRMALALYSSVYIVDTVLLYSYSAFGMPISTTACLVCELIGAAFALKFFGIIHWDKTTEVFTGIVCSIVASGSVAYIIQRIVRAFLRDRHEDLRMLLRHGWWIGGGMLAGIVFFLVVKGLKQIAWVKTINSMYLKGRQPLFVLALWALFGVGIYLLLVAFRDRAAKRLFPVLTLIGMVAMAMAFGQNDLANCAAPGLATVSLFEHRSEGVAAATEVKVAWYYLTVCGALLVVGMATKNAQRVTRAEVNTGSLSDNVALWAPKWCVCVGRFILRFRLPGPSRAPAPAVTPAGKKVHYDALRASVILAVSASVIATASGLGLPVSTTYVAFAAVIGTGTADRILHRGDADLKLGRTIWVVFSWFASGIIAFVASGVVCRLVYHAGIAGMVIGIGANVLLRFRMGRISDQQEEDIRAAARARRQPDHETVQDHELEPVA